MRIRPITLHNRMVEPDAPRARGEVRCQDATHCGASPHSSMPTLLELEPELAPSTVARTREQRGRPAPSNRMVEPKREVAVAAVLVLLAGCKSSAIRVKRWWRRACDGSRGRVCRCASTQ